MIFFASVGVDADADELTGSFDDFWMAELTVLRMGVARSEDARDATALGGDGHEEDRLVGAFSLGKAGGEFGIPSDAGVAEGEIRFAEIGRTWALSVA